MLSILKDLVAHTTPIGSVSFLKLSKKNGKAIIESVDDQKNLILFAESANDVSEYDDVFGIGDLGKLAYFLKNPEYQKNAKIEVITELRDGVNTPTKVLFENEAGDFRNTYRFMAPNVINIKLGKVAFAEPRWDVRFNPSVVSINRLKLMAGAHPEEAHFKFSSKDGNVMLSFGDASSHAGEFVFQPDVNKKVSDAFYWPINLVIPILNTDGDKEILISNEGLIQINVTSGLVNYKFMIPAQQK